MNNNNKKLKEPDTLSGEIVDRLAEIQKGMDRAWEVIWIVIAELLSRAGALDDVLEHFEGVPDKGDQVSFKDFNPLKHGKIKQILNN